MSTKTNFKRIALVAVAALGAGVLSVAPANAAEGDTTYNAATLLVGTTAPTVTTNAGTATLVVGGTITLTMATAASHAGLFTVTGGTVVSASSESGGSVISSATSARQLTDNKTITATFQASTAGTNMVIKSYADWEDAAAVDTWTVTVVAAGVSGVFSAAKSLISIVDVDDTTALAADAAYANIVANGATGTISYTLKDGLNNTLASTTVVYASVASGNCVIGLNTAPTAGRIVVGVSPSDLLYVAQSKASEDLATTCVIDIEVAGAKVASKTFIFQGAVSKINVTALGRGAKGATNTAMAYITANDAAGNAIAGVALTGAVVNAADGTVVSSVTMSNSGNTKTDASSINSGTSPAAVPATIGWNCTAVGGAVPIRFSTPNGTGGFIYSDTLTAVCAGDPATYTASFDKASYVPGDIATLTITAKDSKGALTNDGFLDRINQQADCSPSEGSSTPINKSK